MSTDTVRGSAYDTVDDASHHHHTVRDVSAQLPVSKLVYTVSLLVALWIVQHATDTTIFNAVEQHEPSIRIFRALFEVVLLLLCCAASIGVWTRYITVPVTKSLLFQPVEQSLTPGWMATKAHDDDEEGVQFDDVRSGDLFEKNDENSYVSSTKEEPQEVDAEGENMGLNDTSKLPEAITELGDDDETAIEADDANAIPSPMAVFSAALDLLVWILVALVLYTVTAIYAVNLHPSEESNNVVRMLASIAAPTFPLLLIAFAAVRAVHPWRKRVKVITIVSYTLGAPWYDVTFRDGMIGDILTSMVRPLQDIAFTVCYILFGLRGWWSDSYFVPEASQTEREFITTDQSDMFASTSSTFLEAADASVPAMERSWLLHTAILPACMISPLWWRFLQNMRQTYDTKKRWPYLGNALKYFVAAQVAMVGVYHPRVQQNALWLTSFVLATLYQIWWDLFMDWGLFVRDPLTGGWNLRSQRLYPSQSIYWALAVVNTLLRFCWTLSFVPLRYLSTAGVLTNNFSSDTWASILAPTIASAEVVRRTLWGLLRVEWEAIKVRGEENGKNHDENDDGGLEMMPMKMQGGGVGVGATPLERLGLPPCTSDMSSMNNMQVLGELCLYSTVFAILGLIIAAHRETL